MWRKGGEKRGKGEERGIKLEDKKEKGGIKRNYRNCLAPPQRRSLAAFVGIMYLDLKLEGR
jgi:hypothetical protein